MKNEEVKYWDNYVDEFINGNLTLPEIESNYSTQLSNIIRYVLKNSKLYQQLFSKNDDTYRNQLRSIPFTTKDALRNVGIDACSMSLDDIQTYYETTGTTGKPTPCPRATIDVQTSTKYVQEATKRIYSKTFGSMHALTAIMGPSELYAFGDTYGNVCQNLGIPFVRLWPESPRVGLQKAAELIQQLKVKSLICSPAIAMALSKYYRSNGIDPRRLCVKEILLLGELCTPNMLQNISKLWNVHCTHGLYGSQEINTFATGDYDGTLNISETNFISEILPVDELNGRAGELCVTMLVPGAKPLVRFRTGDLAKIVMKDNQKTSRKIKIFGRLADMLMIGSKYYMPAEVEEAILDKCGVIEGYEVQIDKDKNGLDILNVAIVNVDKNVDSQIMKKALEDYFGVTVELITKDSLNSRTETGSYVSWKYARIVDKRTSNAS